MVLPIFFTKKRFSKNSEHNRKEQKRKQIYNLTCACLKILVAAVDKMRIVY